MARVDERKDVCNIYSEERGRLEDPGVDGKVILKLVLKKQDARVCIWFVCLMKGSVGELL
jgi:hypothetical protein